MARILLILVCVAFVACSNEGETTTKLDSIKVSVDSSAARIGDSIRIKADRLEDTVEARLRDRDSAR